MDACQLIFQLGALDLPFGGRCRILAAPLLKLDARIIKLGLTALHLSPSIVHLRLAALQSIERIVQLRLRIVKLHPGIVDLRLRHARLIVKLRLRIGLQLVDTAVRQIFRAILQALHGIVHRCLIGRPTRKFISCAGHLHIYLGIRAIGGKAVVGHIGELLDGAGAQRCRPNVMDDT